MVYRYDCRYLPYSSHFSEFMSIFFHEKTDNARTLEVRRLLGAQSINAERTSLLRMKRILASFMASLNNQFDLQVEGIFHSKNRMLLHLMTSQYRLRLKPDRN